MDSSLPASKSHSLFQVFLRLRPPQAGAAATERFIDVEPPVEDSTSTAPTHIRLNPPNDRRRAIEKFCFTQVLEEDASQLDVLHCTNVVPLVEGVLAPHGGEGTDALLATLGVTGSGKSHTILGSRSQRGLTQLTLDVLFRSIADNIADSTTPSALDASISASDASEATIYTASTFLDSVYAEVAGPSRHSSRAPTPMIVRDFSIHTSSDPLPLSIQQQLDNEQPHDRNSSLSGLSMPGMFPTSPSGLPRPCNRLASVRIECRARETISSTVPQTPTHHPASVAADIKTPATVKRLAASAGEYPPSGAPPPTPRRLLNRPSVFPQQPDVSGISVTCDPTSEYAVLISMYEVYNDRIFDLLTPPIKSAATKEYRRRPLLFKSTELSPDRKVVAGLRKVICSNLNQALLVLEAGLHERRVAGTGSNSVSSRSHGFVCIEVKKRGQGHHREHAAWSGNVLTIVDLAGSERARDAKTAGATLAEAGKINESLMYLGQCLQMQSDAGNSSRPNVVPFRQCKLTELLFSNSFPSATMSQASHFGQSVRRNPQKAVMIVTADPHGDFNATSQILRYSALAREITVPRIPSITQTIMGTAQIADARSGPISSSPPLSTISVASGSSNPSSHAVHHHRPFFPPGSTANTAPHNRTFSPCSNASSEDRVTMEIAALEIARLSEEADYLRSALEQETERRAEAESHLLSVTDRMLEQEQEIREECAIAFEQRLVVEMARWKAGLEVEKERGEEHWDRKVEVLERLQNTEDDENSGFICCDHDDKENVLVENLEEENERLRRELAVLKRELNGRSPLKRKPLREREDLPTAPSPAPSTPRSTGRSGGEKLTGRDKSVDKASESIRRKMERLRMSEDDTDSIMGRSSSRPSDRYHFGRPSGASVKAIASNGSPKKIRKLSPRKWDMTLDDDDIF